MTTKDLTFTIKTIRFDENYTPSESTRATTNFANLARGQSRQENLRNALRMIDNRCNDLAHWIILQAIATRSSLTSFRLNWMSKAMARPSGNRGAEDDHR